QGNAGPVVGLEFWHGHEEIDAHDRPGKIQLPQSRGMRFERNALHVVHVQIYERAGEGAGKLPKPNGLKDSFGVPVQGRAIANENLGGPQAQKTLARSGNDGWMSVYDAQGVEADEIGLQKHGLAANGEIEFTESFVNECSE